MAISKTTITPSDVIYGLSEVINKKYRRLVNSFVFDPEDIYERAITAGRVEQFYREPIDLDQKKVFQDRKLLPMLAWNRTNLIPSTLNGRAFSISCDAHGDTQFRHALCEFTFNFTYYSTNMTELEQFELDWNLQQGLRSVDRIHIITSNDMPPFVYSVVWEPELQSINFSLDSNYYKSLSGTAKISGSFVSFINKPDEEIGNLIREIRLAVFDCEGNEIIDEAFKDIIQEKVNNGS